MIKLTCTNARKKSITFNNEDGKLMADSVLLENVKHVFIFPCTLTSGDVEIVILFHTPTSINNKTELFLRRNWCNQPMGKFNDDEDDLSVKELNDAVQKLFESCTTTILTGGFEGRVEKTFELSRIFVANNYIISPNAKLIRSLENCNAIFFERVTSYTRTFDMTCIFGNATFSVVSIQRKVSFAYVKDVLKKHQIYETGPDPIPWNMMLKKKQEEKLSWKQMHDLISGENDTSDDDESEWSEGQTDDDENEEDEESEESEDCVDDEDEVDYIDYPSSEESDDDSSLDYNRDYDAWEANETPSKKRKVAVDECIVKDTINDMITKIENDAC